MMKNRWRSVVSSTGSAVVFVKFYFFYGNSIMQALGRFKLHLLALLVVMAADAIGIQKFGIVVLLPLLYAMVFFLFLA